MKPIGWVDTPYPEKFGIPRQPGLVEAARGTLHLHPEFRQSGIFDGLEASSHLWLIFLFHQSAVGWSPKVRPPRLGGNQKLGVFATRSPRRPNPIGLSVVELLEVREVSLELGGLDLVDGTPILDIKPYLPYTDLIPGAHHDVAAAPPKSLEVRFEPEAAHTLEEARLLELTEQVLAQDPRPAYHEEGREYGTSLRDKNIRWKVVDGVVVVMSAT